MTGGIVRTMFSSVQADGRSDSPISLGLSEDPFSSEETPPSHLGTSHLWARMGGEGQYKETTNCHLQPEKTVRVVSGGEKAGGEEGQRQRMR